VSTIVYAPSRCLYRYATTNSCDGFYVSLTLYYEFEMENENVEALGMGGSLEGMQLKSGCGTYFRVRTKVHV